MLTAGFGSGGDDTSTAFAGVISPAGPLTKGGTVTLTGANTYTGGTTVNTRTLEGNSTPLQGVIAVAALATLLVIQPTNGTFAGVVSGAGTMTKAGAGTLTLTGHNSLLTGPTNLNGGTVTIGAATNLAFNGGTPQTTAALTLANTASLAASGGTVQADAATTLSGVISGAQPARCRATRARR